MSKLKILIIRTDRVGDVILATPVIKNLREAFKGAFIAFMCRPYTKDILEGNPYLDKVIVYDKYGKHKSLFSTIKFAFSLKKYKFDWAIILHPTNRAHLIAFIAKIPLRIGWDKKMAYLLTEKIPYYKNKGNKHELEYNLDVLRRLNIPIISKDTYFPIKKEALEKLNGLLEQENVNIDEKFIVIHPCASCISKRWPQSSFIELIKLLKEKTNLKIIIVTAPAESEFAQEIADSNLTIDLRGKVTLPMLGALINKASLFISNDSGPVHIAASLNIPVISIFGRKNPGLSPTRWKPQGEKSVYLHKDIGCIQCLAHNCEKEFLCLKEIKPEEVAEKALLLLKKEY